MRDCPSEHTITIKKRTTTAKTGRDKQLDELGLEYVPTSYQELGYAGEQMLNHFLKKMGYDGIRYPDTAFTLWKEHVIGNPFNQYLIKIKARGIDNWIRQQLDKMK